MICPEYPNPIFFFFTNEAPSLLYYSHVPSIIISLLVGVFVLYKNKYDLSARVLFGLSLTFSIWTLLSLITWTNNSSDTIMFVWSFFGFLYSLISILALYFIFVFTNKKDVSFRVKFIFFLALLPIVLLTPTNENIYNFDLELCSASSEGFYFTNYYYMIGFGSFIWGLVLLLLRYKKTSGEQRKETLLFGVGILLFLFSFFITGYIPSVFVENSYSLEFYGLFGMTFFMAMLGYIIVRFKAFNIKLIGAQALVVALWLLIGSLLLVVKSPTSRVISTLTFILAVIGGYFLIKSVKKEVKQREEIELLAKQLQVANERLKVLDKMKSEFVSIASHQLRGPLTSIRGYASMLSEGSYGKIPQKAQEVLDKMAESAKFMALSVEDYLNVSRIEAGNMKYEMSDFNVRDLAEKITDEVRPVAMKKGLVIVFRSDCNGSCMVHADIGKTRQVIMNLLDNSMKYTPKGTITTVVHDDPKKKKLYIKIQDTGVGMSKETLEEVFDKFVRAKNANQINVTGTGLGLYVAKKMVTEMGGKVWAESDGEGKGSRFIVEFPTIPGKIRQ